MGQHWLALCSVELLTPGTPTFGWLPPVSQIQVILGVTPNVSLLLLHWRFKEILHDHVLFCLYPDETLCRQVIWKLFYKLYWHLLRLLCSSFPNQYTFLWGTIHLTLLIVFSRYVPPSIHLLPGVLAIIAPSLWPVPVTCATTQVRPATEMFPYRTIKAHYVSNLSQWGPIISQKTHLDIDGDYSL